MARKVDTDPQRRTAEILRSPHQPLQRYNSLAETTWPGRSAQYRNTSSARAQRDGLPASPEPTVDEI